jgi:putative transposase
LQRVYQHSGEEPGGSRAVDISMAKESYENPIAERINGILKDELLRPGYPKFDLAQKAIKKAVRIYNTERPHRIVPQRAST